MRRVKVRTYSGVVCEQEVFDISDKLDVRTARPRRPRFATPEEREQLADFLARAYRNVGGRLP